MDTEGKIYVWARKCGFTGPLAKDMKSFCNESTLHIWDQIITKVKPREEVEGIQRKLIVHRLKAEFPLKQAVQKQYEVYNKLHTSRKLKDACCARIMEKELQLKQVGSRILRDTLELEQERTRNEELEMKIFLLDEKRLFLAGELIAKVQSKSALIENACLANKESNISDKQDFSFILQDAVRNNCLEKQKVDIILKCNTSAVLDEIHSTEKSLLKDLWNATGNSGSIKSSITNEDTNNLKLEKYGLYAMHVQYEFDAQKSDASIKTLRQSLQNFEIAFKAKLFAGENSDIEDVNRILKSLHSQSNLVGLDSATISLRKRIETMTQQVTLQTKSTNKLDQVRAQLQQINDSLNMSAKIIAENAEEVEEIHRCAEVVAINWKVSREMLLALDLDYLYPLNDGIVSTELRLFPQYPLEFNKQYNLNDTSQYFRNYRPFTQRCSKVLADCNINPLQTPWEILLSTYTNLLLFKQLTRSMEESSREPIVSPYPLVAFERNAHAATLQALVYHVKSAREHIRLDALRVRGRRMQGSLNDWLEMKFSAYLTVDRMVNGHRYDYYESEFFINYNLLE